MSEQQQQRRHKKKKKLRVLIISMGGPRQEILRDLFERQPALVEAFDPPTFCPGIPSRSLRNREQFFRHCHAVGLLPEAEWKALQEGFANVEYQEHTERFFECLKDVPIPARGRRGSDYDVSLHYSVELWRKAKTVNRGRAVLACALAHLSALKRLVSEGYDLLLEDNVRFPVEQVARRIRETVCAVTEWESKTGNRCHIRYFGWLGSTTNLEWIDSSHKPRTTFERDANSTTITCFPMPTLQDIEADLVTQKDNDDGKHATAVDECNNSKTPVADSHSQHQQPGGNPVWGAYAYWVSKDAYEMLTGVLRNDVGALLWKSKRMRYYQVKPIDKILPRQIRDQFGSASVQLASHPAFFRAPMLTSKIHAQWDPEFCKSTTRQLQQTGLEWSSLALTLQERKVVAHFERAGEWLAPAPLKEKETES